MGKQIGEFSMKVITSTLTPGQAGTTLIACNVEGVATGFGPVADAGHSQYLRWPLVPARRHL